MRANMRASLSHRPVRNPQTFRRSVKVVALHNIRKDNTNHDSARRAGCSSKLCTRALSESLLEARNYWNCGLHTSHFVLERAVRIRGELHAGR